MKKTICHIDGTISYWSVYHQAWIARAYVVRDRELAAMGVRERERVIAHLAQKNKQEETA